MKSVALPRAAIRDLERAVGRGNVLWRPEEIVAFEYDATIERFAPQAVVFPGSAEEVSAVVRVAQAHRLPIIPRGAGTGLSGGAVAAVGGVIVALTRLNRILELDVRNRIAVVEPGVVNLELSKAAAPYGLTYVPDPSSQRACTIGGNVAENAGGPHCLAYGATTNHVLGLEVVLPDGTITWTGGKTRLATGYDLTGVLVGSEGTLAIVTKAAVRLVPLPESVRTLLAIFDEVDHASNAVSAIIAHGFIPAALEMLDCEIIKAVEPALHVGYPLDAGAVLLIEVEGLREATRAQADEIRILCLEQGAREVRLAEDPEDRERLWAGRKGAIGALGRLAPNYYVLDGVVPRTKLPDVLRGVYDVCGRAGFPVANVFHAGDGNLHPNVLFDARDPDATRRVLEVGAEIMRLCVDAGGSITGEHGVGLEKRDFMSWIFSEDDLDAMARVKRAFVTGDAAEFNPCKAFPTTKGCGELTSQHIERMRDLFGGDLYI